MNVALSSFFSKHKYIPTPFFKNYKIKMKKKYSNINTIEDTTQIRFAHNPQTEGVCLDQRLKREKQSGNKRCTRTHGYCSFFFKKQNK